MAANFVDSKTTKNTEILHHNPSTKSRTFIFKAFAIFNIEVSEISMLPRSTSPMKL